MTFLPRSGHATPAARAQPALHLVEEVVRGDPQPEEREAEDEVAGERDLVLPERVRQNLSLIHI